MESVKKILCVIALMLSLIGTVWSYVSVIKMEDSIVPVLGLTCVVAAAVPTWVKLVKYLLA